MKRLLILVFIACMTIGGNSFAQVVTATMGDQNESNVYRLTTYTETSGSVNYGYLKYASDTGIYMPYTSSTTNQTLTAYQSGTTLIFNGASNGTRFLLPTAVVGMQYTIASDVAFWFYIDAQSTDTIKFSTASAGQRISNSATAAAGDSITLFCATANTWTIKNRVGTWAVGPGQ